MSDDVVPLCVPVSMLALVCVEWDVIDRVVLLPRGYVEFKD